MLIFLEPTADASKVKSALQGLGLWTELVRGDNGTAALEVGAHSQKLPREQILAVAGVADVVAAASAHPRVDAQAGKPVRVGDLRVGADADKVLMAGPCSVESEEQIFQAAAIAARAGARFLRGGAFKPRSSPYGFQGHGRTALQWMRRAADAHGLAVVTELLGEAEIDVVAEHADLIQIGSRNMQNFALLRAAGKCGRPVLLKRGMAARIEEWLLAGEHLLHAGVPGVIFCERGVMGFDPSTRNLLDLGAVALLRHVMQQPIIVDTSHAAGRRDLIGPLSRAAMAAGADGLILEAHPDPSKALSDGAQSLDADALVSLGRDVVAARPAARAVA